MENVGGDLPGATECGCYLEKIRYASIVRGRSLRGSPLIVYMPTGCRDEKRVVAEDIFWVCLRFFIAGGTLERAAITALFADACGGWNFAVMRSFSGVTCASFACSFSLGCRKRLIGCGNRQL